jgi:hypothetical protein
MIASNSLPRPARFEPTRLAMTAGIRAGIFGQSKKPRLRRPIDWRQCWPMPGGKLPRRSRLSILLRKSLPTWPRAGQRRSSMPVGRITKRLPCPRVKRDWRCKWPARTPSADWYLTSSRLVISPWRRCCCVASVNAWLRLVLCKLLSAGRPIKWKRQLGGWRICRRQPYSSRRL